MAINLLLQGSRSVCAEDIATRFEISLRTVYRDLAALGEAGVPIVGEAGVGYSLMRGYRLPPVMFTAEEASALATAGLTAKDMGDGSLTTSIESALLKVKAVLPIEGKERFERLEQSQAMGFANNAKEASSANLIEIQEALAAGKPLRIIYESGGRRVRTKRVVEPIGLVYYLEKWHLIAWCRLRADDRDFRIDRIQEMEILNEKPTNPRNVSLSDYFDRECRAGASIETNVWFHRDVLDRAKRGWSLGLLYEGADGQGVVLSLSTGDLDWMVGWILSFGDKARVIEPVELRERVAAEARKLVIHHES